jgi:hypothetical protein
MNTQSFLNTLEKYKNKELLFQYAPNLFVGTNYHITEVKHATIDSVDCGAQTDSWKETIVQLWESPKELGKTNYMKAGKALQILMEVGTLRAYNSNAIVKIEYGNATFHATQQCIDTIVVKENLLIMQLTVDEVRCKAIELCGIPVKEVEAATTCCDPSSGCC